MSKINKGFLILCVLVVASIVANEQNSENQAREPFMCALVGKKFHVGDLVQVHQPSHKFDGCVAYIVEDDAERIAHHRTLNDCPDHCIVYSLMTVHNQDHFECCQPYLAKAQAK